MSSVLPHLTVLINLLVLYHLLNNTLHRMGILESVLAKPHLQTYQVAPPFQFCLLVPNALDL